MLLSRKSTETNSVIKRDNCATSNWLKYDLADYFLDQGKPATKSLAWYLLNEWFRSYVDLCNGITEVSVRSECVLVDGSTTCAWYLLVCRWSHLRGHNRSWQILQYRIHSYGLSLSCHICLYFSEMVSVWNMRYMLKILEIFLRVTRNPKMEVDTVWKLKYHILID